MTYKQLLTFGSIAKDEMMTFPGEFHEHIDPGNLEKLNMIFAVDKLEQELGGIATNISYNFKLLSNKEAYVLGGIGKDGQIFVDFFNENGIDTSFLIQSEDLYTATFKGISSKNQNQIGAFYYGATEAAKEIVLESIPDYNQSLLVISANHPDAFYKIQKEAIDLGMHYLYDPGMALSWITDESLKKGLEKATYLVTNDYEMAQIQKRTGMSLQDILSNQVAVIVTKGEDGLEYIDSDRKIQVPAFKVENFVDPTGAGDSFRGGFLAGIMDGMDLADSLSQGAALASFAVENRGGINHTFEKQEFIDRFGNIRSRVNL